MAKKEFAISLKLLDKNFKGGITKIQQSLQGLQSSISKMFVGIGVAEFGRKILDATSQVDKMRASFNTFTADAAKGGKMLQDVMSYASNTPYSFKGVADGATTLMQFGVSADNVIPTLKQLGDVAMGDNERLKSLSLAFAQMTSAGRLMGQDLLQMVNAGFNPLIQISKDTGKSLAELKDDMSKGKISVDMVMKSLKKATSEGGMFNGAMDNMSKTVAGKLNKLSGTVDLFFAKIGQSANSPINEVIDDFQKIVDWGTKNINSIIRPFVTAFSFIVNNAKTIGIAITTAFTFKKATEAFNFLKTAWNGVQTSIIQKAITTTSELSRLQNKITISEGRANALRQQLAAAEGDKKLAIQVRLNEQLKTLEAQRTQNEKLQTEARVANQRAAALQSAGAWGKCKIGMMALGSTLKSVLATNIWMIATASAVTLLTKVYDIITAVNRLKDASNGYKKELSDISHSSEIVQLNTILRQYKEAHGDVNKQKQLLNTLSSKYGVVVKNINSALNNEKLVSSEINKQIRLLKARAKAELASNKIAQLESDRDKLVGKYVKNNTTAKVTGKDGKVTYRQATGEEKSKKALENINAKQKKNNQDAIQGGKNNPYGNPMALGSLAKNIVLESDKNQIIEYDRQIKQVNKDLENAVKEGGLTINSNEGGSADDDSSDTDKGGKKTNPVEEAEQSLAKSIKEAELGFKEGWLNKGEYHEAIKNAYESYANTIHSLGKPVSDDIKSKWQDHSKKLEEYNKAVEDAKKEVERQKEFQKDFKEVSEMPEEAEGKKTWERKVNLQGQDTIDSNNYSDAVAQIEVLQEKQKAYNELLKQAQTDTEKAQIAKGLSGVNDQLTIAISQATTLNDKIQLKKAQEEIQNLKTDVDKLTEDSIRGCYEGLKGVYSGVKNVADTLNNSDANFFDKLVAILDLILSMKDRVKGLIDMFSELSKRKQELGVAQKGVDNFAKKPTVEVGEPTTTDTSSPLGMSAEDKDEQIANIEEVSAAKQEAADLAADIGEQQVASDEAMSAASDLLATKEQANAIKSQAIANTDKATSKSVTNAKKGEATSKGAASAMSLPFPANIAANLAVMMALQAIFGMITGSFANGGVIQGNRYHGDGQLARVNAGEMILNNRQQKNLFNAINSGKLSSGGATSGRVEFTLRGDKLQGVLDNYNAMKR